MRSGSRFATRSDAVERLDATTHDPVDLARTFRHLEGVNRWLGGTRIVRHYLTERFASLDEMRVLDVGTGSGDIPRTLLRWAEATGRRLGVVAIDACLDIARMAADRHAGPTLVVAVGQGERLPFHDKVFDVALASLTLHHLTHEAAVMCLREMARVSRRAVLINDLERHRLNYLGARLMAATLWRRDPYTRYDGPVSVLRSFRRDELVALGKAAGLATVEVRRHFPFRLALFGTTHEDENGR